MCPISEFFYLRTVTLYKKELNLHMFINVNKEVLHFDVNPFSVR